MERLGADVSVVPLEDPLPGWWNKVRLFDPRLTPFRHLVFVDLDVVILKPIDHLLEHVGRAELVHAQDLLDDMSSSFMIVDTHSALARDVVAGFAPGEWSAADVNDQHYFQKVLRQGRYETIPLPWPDHYSYKYLIDHGDWRARTVNRNIEVMPLERITMLNLHGYPKPHDVRDAPDTWPHADAILRHWRAE